LISADVMWVMARNGSKSIAGWSRVGERQRLSAVRGLRLLTMAMKYGPYSAISVRVDNGLLLLTLDRPEQLNTFTSAMMNELADVFTLVNRDDDGARRASKLTPVVRGVNCGDPRD